MAGGPENGREREIINAQAINGPSADSIQTASGLIFVDESFEQVAFAARYKEWLVVKKLLIVPDTKPEEVSLALASIDKTLAKKMYEFSGINTDIVETHVASVAKRGRQFSNLSQIFGSLKPGEVKAALLPACPTPTHYPIAENYFIKRLMEEVGYRTVLDPETLAEVFPHLKVAKPRGNFGKKKK